MRGDAANLSVPARGHPFARPALLRPDCSAVAKGGVGLPELGSTSCGGAGAHTRMLAPLSPRLRLLTGGFSSPSDKSIPTLNTLETSFLEML